MYLCYINRIENMRNYCNIMHTKNQLMKNKEKKMCIKKFGIMAEKLIKIAQN